MRKKIIFYFLIMIPVLLAVTFAFYFLITNKYSRAHPDDSFIGFVTQLMTGDGK